MSLRTQLKELQARRTTELENLQRAVRHTQRDVSPKRFIRKYPYAALGAAAVAGMLIAPAPRYVKITGTAAVGTPSSGGSSSWLLRILKRYIPQLGMFEKMAATATPDAHGTGRANGHAHAAGASPEAPGFAQTNPLQDVVRQGLLILLSRIDIAAIIHAWIDAMKQRRQEGESAAKSPDADTHDAGVRRPPPPYTP